MVPFFASHVRGITSLPLIAESGIGFLHPHLIARSDPFQRFGTKSLAAESADDVTGCVWHRRPKTQNPKPKTQNPKPKIQDTSNPEFYTRLSFLFPDTLSAVSSMSYQRAVLGEAGLAANKAAGMPGNGHRRTMLPKVTSGTAGRKPNPVSTAGGSSGPGDAKKGAGLPTAAEGAGKGVWSWPKSIPSRLRSIRLGPGAGAGEEKGGQWKSGMGWQATAGVVNS